MQISTFESEVHAVGGRLSVNGEDITDQLVGWDVSVRPGQPTQLTLYAIPGEGMVGGVATTTALRPSSDIDWSQLSAEQIQDEAMNRQGFDSEFEDKSLVEHVIDIIKEKLT